MTPCTVPELPQAMLDLADHTEARYEVIDKILDISEVDNEIWFQVMWDGLRDKRDWTWQRAKILYADVPETVRQFLDTCKKKALTAKTKHHLGIFI